MSGEVVLETAVQAVTLGWEIIKDGTPVPVTQNQGTAVLNKADMNWANYDGAKISKSEKLTFTLDQSNYPLVPVPTNIAKAEYSIECSYGARYNLERGGVKRVAPGYYLPSVSIIVHNSFNIIGTSLNTDVRLANITNIAEAGQYVIPYFKMTIQFNIKRMLQAQTFTNEVIIQGDKGITEVGTPKIWFGGYSPNWSES